MFENLKPFRRGNANTKDQLSKMRALHPNILVPEGSWNDQIESVRGAQGCKIAFCVYPSAHTDTFCDTVAAVAEHKKTCWKGPGKN